jgi:uncharacterized delta-60 repeat protein
MRTRLLLVFLLGMLSLTASASADCIDRGFALHGWSLEPAGTAAALVRQPDGKLVIAGLAQRSQPPYDATDILIARYDASGALDPSFGSGGTVHTSLGVFDRANAPALVLQPDGKLVAAGGVDRFTGAMPYPYAPTEVVLVRYLPDGTPDPMFGTNGIVRTSFTAATSAHGIVLTPEGKIVVGGTSASGAFGAPQFFFARYDTQGVLDTSFGTSGSTTMGSSTSGNALVRQSDGKLVLAGFEHDQGVDNFALGRVDGNGSPDAGFGTGGVVVTDIALSNGQNSAQALVVQPGDKLVAAGNAYGRGFTLVRYQGDGSLDPSFGSGGIASTLEGSVAFGLTIDGSGRLVAAGHGYGGPQDHVVLARFTADGALDSTFGGTGVVATDYNPLSDDVAYAVVAQPDGTIVIAGTVDYSEVLLARYLGSGCSACDPPDCPVPPACLQLAGRNRLMLVRKPGKKGYLSWRWTGSRNAIDPIDLGDAATANYYLQLFDGSFGVGQVVEWGYFSSQGCSTHVCWTAVNHGLRFTSPHFLDATVNLRSGPPGKGALGIRWRYSNLFSGLSGLLPLTPPVSIRFVRGDGRTCFVSHFAGDVIRKNDSFVFDGH